ncbi:formimidoylglutamase [Psychroflexus sp. ALD_RP9]|uniref:formimidoylglutamase n=1 Tax=Psychroflexus sp. ALD_RP9 TaxID=2777186 RepID=UPI001A8E4310|nr:formimidoylglutamase [Psychroflexus sp. ALD_RP9]QSS97707.1 formimidoylglutamase [Psychroflexus sp. ALD_RP9]
MNLEFLQVVSEDFKLQFKSTATTHIFHQVKFYNHDEEIELSDYDIAIISVDENRNSIKSKCYRVDHEQIRYDFYSLNPGSWSSKIIDLGHIKKGETVNDTFFLIKSVISELLKAKLVPLIIGGSQDIVYPIYRAFDGFQYMINVTNVDAKFDLGSSEEDFSNHSFVGKIIVDEPYNLFNYSNLGYLTFHNAQHEIDLMEKLFFEAYRFGEINRDITIVEPVLRDSDLVSLDFSSVSSSTLADATHFMPNGFDGMQMCTIARYSGLSDRVKCFHLGELGSVNSTPNFNHLLVQVIWYFIEGFNLKSSENISTNNKNIISYKVPIDFKNDDYLEFLHSKRSNKWWIKASDNFLHNNNIHFTFISCCEQDYKDACAGKIPQRWCNAKLKGYF